MSSPTKRIYGKPHTTIWVGIRYADYPSLSKVIPPQKLEEIKISLGYAHFRTPDVTITEFFQDEEVIGLGALVYLIEDHTEALDLAEILKALEDTRKIFERLGISVTPQVYVTSTVIP